MVPELRPGTVFKIVQYLNNDNITFMFFLVMILALNFGETFIDFFFLFLSPEPLSSERSVQILFQYCITKQALNDLE